MFNNSLRPNSAPENVIIRQTTIAPIQTLTLHKSLPTVKQKAEIVRIHCSLNKMLYLTIDTQHNPILDSFEFLPDAQQNSSGKPVRLLFRPIPSPIVKNRIIDSAAAGVVDGLPLRFRRLDSAGRPIGERIVKKHFDDRRERFFGRSQESERLFAGASKDAFDARHAHAVDDVASETKRRRFGRRKKTTLFKGNTWEKEIQLLKFPI